MEKTSFNILVTDHTRIEFLAALFLSAVRGRTNSTANSKEVKWRKKPKWSHTQNIPLHFHSQELNHCILNLYRFPDAIKRNFELDDLEIKFDAGLFIVDLGNTKLWSRDVTDSDRSTSVWNHLVLNEIENYLNRADDKDSEKIWGVEVLNQISELKVILAVQSAPKSVPFSDIAEYFQFTSPPDMIVCQVNHDSWLHLYDSFPNSVIQNVTTTFENRLLNMDKPI